jgi:CheY-like chemotaxis protein
MTDAGSDIRRRPQGECPSCRSTKVLQTTTGSGDASFLCGHCNHIWSGAPPAALRVLVVDDEEGIRALVNRALRTAGYDVVTASDGLDGLQVFEHERPFDLCLLDVKMPGLTGDELAQQVRRMDPDCKVLYFTGFSDQLFNAKSALWENEAFIEKPASPTALLEAVSLLLFGHTHGPSASPTS